MTLDPTILDKLVRELLAAKEASGKTYDEIATELGVTNVYCANLFYNQAQLKKGTAPKLKKIVPALSDGHLDAMQLAPFRTWPDNLLQEPNVYRTYEAIMHNGEAIKALINEQAGDGIMSAIDFYCSVKTIKGKAGEDRVVLTFNGKYLKHIEQFTEDDTSQ
eukprot:gene610-1037_t